MFIGVQFKNPHEAGCNQAGEDLSLFEDYVEKIRRKENVLNITKLFIEIN